MQSPEPHTPERQAIQSALQRVERRLRLNRILHSAALLAGFVLLALITWRALAWLGGTAPAIAALVVLLAILGGIALLGLLGLSLFLGIYPKPLLERVEPSVKALIAHVEERSDYRAPKVSEQSPDKAAEGGHE